MPPIKHARSVKCAVGPSMKKQCKGRGFSELARSAKTAKQFRVSLLALWLLTVWAGGQGETKVLDLTAFEPPAGAPAGWGGGGLGGVLGTPLTISRPLQLSLVKVIPEGGRPGDSFVYEASLRNVGSSPILIPWSPDWKSVQEGRETPPPGYLEAWLSLFVDDASGKKRRLGESLLFGSPETVGTIVELKPGDQVRFRALGSWPREEDSAAGVPVKLRVQFSFLYGPAEVNSERRYFSEPRTFVLQPR